MNARLGHMTPPGHAPSGEQRVSLTTGSFLGQPSISAVARLNLSDLGGGTRLMLSTLARLARLARLG